MTETMMRFTATALLIGSAFGAQAMPLASVPETAPMVEKVADGCGPGFSVAGSATVARWATDLARTVRDSTVRQSMVPASMVRGRGPITGGPIAFGNQEGFRRHRVTTSILAAGFTAAR